MAGSRLKETDYGPMPSLIVNGRKKTTSGELMVRGMRTNDPVTHSRRKWACGPKNTRTFLLMLKSVHAPPGVKLFNIAHCD
jgi:hypothetical protein